MRSDGDRGGSREGFALVAVLAVTALLSSMLLGLSLWSRNAVENAAVSRSAYKMESLLRSAATIAAYQLFVLKLPPARINGQRLALDSGAATVTLSDDSGKVDLNGAGPELLAAAYRASGLSGMPPAMFAARVLDWRDGDLNVSENGAELAAYQSAGLPPPRDGAFRSASDLLWVLGLGEKDVAALASFVTVFNPAGRINPYAASPMLIKALTGLSTGDGSQLRALLERPRTKDSDGRVAGLLTEHTGQIDFEAPMVIRISILGRLSESDVTKRVELIAAASVSDSTPFHVFRLEEETN